MGQTKAATEDTILVEKKATEGTATSRELTVNLITCGLGTGVFTLPWSTAGASVIPATLITAAVLALNAWTMGIIVEAGERHQTFNLGALLGRLPGRWGHIAEAVVNGFIWFSTYLCLVSYLIVISDCMASMVFTGPVGSYRPVFVFLAACLVLPLCFLDQSRLSFTSTFAVVATAAIFANICTQFVYEDLQGSRPQACYLGLSTGSIAMVSAMMQTVVIQMCVLPMYEELKDRTPAKFNSIVTFSFSALFLICTSFAVIGYLAFGQEVSSNVLLNLPDTHWGHMTRACAAVAVIAVYPIIMNPMMAPLRSTEVARQGGPLFNFTCTVAIVGMSMVAAIAYNDLGFVNVVNGAISCGAFVAFAPSLVGLYLLGHESASWRVTMYALMVVGTVFAILGILMTDNYAASLHNACMWSQPAGHSFANL